MIHWISNVSGHKNEQMTCYKGVYITVYSDQEEKDWVYYFDNNEDDLTGTFDSKDEAIKDALSEVEGK